MDNQDRPEHSAIKQAVFYVVSCFILAMLLLFCGFMLATAIRAVIWMMGG